VTLTRPRLAAIALASAVLAVIAGQWIDWPLARWVASFVPNPAWPTATHVLEYAAGIEPSDYTLPAILVVGALVALRVARWRRLAPLWIYLTITNLLARNLMMWGKFLAGRLRPHQWIHVGGPTFGHIGTGASFPSGHVTLFGGLIVPLVVAFPRLRPLLIVVVYIMIARIAVMAHFASDTLAGLALVTGVAWLCDPLRRLKLPEAALRRPAGSPREALG
jgi:membrane-associated phospholipid phosphatase